jgi:hypothetical protein
MSDRMVAVWVVDAGDSRAARPRERKVRTPQSSVPDNVREGEFKLTLRKVPQRIYRLEGRGERTVRAVLLEPDARAKQAQALRSPRINEVRVKRCGKSAPLAQ